MSFEITEGSIALTADAAGFNSTMGRVRASLTRINEVMQRVSATARRMLVVQGAALGFSVKSASDAQETISKFEAVFKEQTESAKAFAAQLAGTINRSKYDLMGYMATLQDTFVPLGFARDKAAQLAQQVTVLAEDLASFNNLPTAEVMASLQSALVGNHETVRKFGVIITQAAIEQELLNMGIRGGVKAASEQEKAMARLNIIMASTADAQGDAVRTAGAFANQFKGLKAASRDLSVEIGMALLPTLSGYIDRIKTALEPLTQWVAAHKELTAGIIKTNVVILAVVASLPLLTGAIWAAEKAVIGITKATAALNAVMMFMARNPLVAVATALAALAGYLVYARLEGESFQEKMVTAGNNIVAAFTAVKNTLKNLFAPVLPLWAEAVEWIKGVMFDVGFAFRNFDELATIGLMSATLAIVKFYEDVKHFFTGVIPQTLRWFGDNWASIFLDLYDGTMAVIKNLAKNILNFVIAVKDWISGKGFNFEWTGLLEGFKRTTEKLPEIAGRAISPMEKALREEIDKATKDLAQKYQSERYNVPKIAEDDEKAMRTAIERADTTSADSPSLSGAMSTATAGSSSGRGIGFVSPGDLWQQMASSIADNDLSRRQFEEAKKQTEQQKRMAEHLERIEQNTKGSKGTVGP